jgi:type I restriction enzyme S subunit
LTRVPSEWVEVALHDFCRPKQWPTISLSDFVSEGYPVYGANGRIGFYSTFNHENPTVLITCRGATCGTVNVSAPRSYVTGNAMALDDLDESRVCREFLVQALRHRGLARAITGTAQPQITRDSLSSISVPLPSMPVQRRIAKMLEGAEALLAKRRAALGQLDTLIESIFLEMFGGVGDANVREIRPLEAYCTFTAGNAWRSDQFTSEHEGLPIIRIQNVAAVRQSEFVYWPHRYDDRFVVRPGQLLLTLSGSFRATIWQGPDALLNQRIVRLEPRPGVDTHWLRYALEIAMATIEAMGRKALLSNVRLSDLKQLPLITPTPSMQREFADRLARIEQARSRMQTSLAQLDALFASLQHRAFRGEL